MAISSPSRSTVSVQRLSASDQSAAVTRCRYRTWSSMPFSVAASVTYCRIEAPSAMAFADAHGLNRNPRVYMSESERMPGYLKRFQVPPRVSRRSRMA